MVDLNYFLEGYRKFSECAGQIGFIKYEDFCSDPDSKLSHICDVLDIPFDKDYTQRWKFYKRLGSDTDEPVQEIRPLQPPQISSVVTEKFESNFDYWPTLKLLGSEHYEITSQTL